MRVVILDSANDVMDCASDFFIQQIRHKANSVLGLATGSTPLALYQKLIEAHKSGLSFKEVTSFNLDEYLGLDASHPQSYHFYMQQALFDHIDICPDSTYVPNGAHENPKQACAEFEAKIEQHEGIDLQLLGIGRNGHIGFNEPSSSLGSRTRVKSLTAETIEDNARFFSEGEFQPRLSLTMGIGTIMDANKVVLIATGEAKAGAIQATIEGPVSAMCPASILQMHQNAVIILDQPAASRLEHIDFYSFVETENRKLEASLSQAY